MGFEASNLTQVPLLSSCTHSGLKPHPLSNELAIVTALGQWSPYRARKEPHCQKWRPYMARRPVRAHEERNGPPRDDQGLSIAKPRSSHVTWAQDWNPPTSPCPTLSAGAEPKSLGHCRKWHHKLKVVWRIYASIAYNRLIKVGVFYFKC